MDINYKVEGRGKPLVFIHGLLDNLLYWEFLATCLKDDFQIIRFDLRGHGESELGSGEIIIDTYVEDLNSLLEELEISNANLIGFSLGGAIAQQFTVKYPDKVDSLVLMSSFYKLNPHSLDVIMRFKEMLNIGFDEFYDFILPLVLCPDVIEKNREELEVIKQMASRTADVDALIKAVDVCLNFNIEKDISKIHVPALVLAGKYDGIFPLESYINLQNQIENSKLIVFDNAKHNILIGKNNEKILKILKDFYKK